MTYFDFNAVIISILVAFALSEILSSWGRLIEHRSRVRSPWLYVVSTGWLFFFLIAHWLGLWAYRDFEFDRLLQSFIVFAPSIVGALCAYVFTPSLSDKGDLDIDEHYFYVARWGYSLVGLFIVLAGLTDILVPGREPLPLFVFLVGGAFMLWLGYTQHRLVHYIVLSIAWVVLVTGVFMVPIKG